MLGRWFDRLLREDLWGRYCWSCDLQEEEELARSGGRTAQEEGSAGARAESRTSWHVCGREGGAEEKASQLNLKV